MDFTLTPRTVVGVRRHVGVDGHTIDDHHSGNETGGKNEFFHPDGMKSGKVGK